MAALHLIRSQSNNSPLGSQLYRTHVTWMLQHHNYRVIAASNYANKSAAESIKQGCRPYATVLLHNQSRLGFGGMAGQRRSWASRVAAERNDNRGVYVYATKGSYDKHKRWMERTRTTCGVSIMLAPYLTLMALPDTNVVLKGVVVSSVIGLSALMNWLGQLGVRRIRWQPGADSFKVQTMSWLGECVTRKIWFRDIDETLSSRVFSFKVNDGRCYFVKSRAALDKAFVARLERSARVRSPV